MEKFLLIIGLLNIMIITFGIVIKKGNYSGKIILLILGIIVNIIFWLLFFT